ncbi:hypothetical protein BSKO_04115 [Bryopsis sp. KO-2023]|nr:hypothetical protein BSKO_04115 [Bryopsis sp. KO-2023]
MKTFFILCVLLGVLSQGECRNGSGRSLKQAACPGAQDTSCSAYSSLDILVLAGRCSGTAAAECGTVSISENSYVEAFDEWWGENEQCDAGKAETAATAIARAVAEVYTSAAVKVTCDGVGFACGWALAEGNTFALAFAEAVAQASAEVVVGPGAEAFCFADIRALSGVFAEAAARAQADACSKGGDAEDWQESFVVAVQQGVARALARATASACAVGAEVAAESECTGEAESTTQEDIVKGGDVCGGVAQLLACTGKAADLCCNSNRNVCTCRGDGCDGFPLIRKSNAGQKASFENRKGVICFCQDDDDDGTSEDPQDDTGSGDDQSTPSGDTPSGDTPAGDTPSGDTPSGDTPSGDTPSGDTPSGDTPSGDTPAGDTPSGDNPSGDTPAGDTPSGDTPSGDTPSGDTPSGDTPSGDTPSGDTPAGDTPSGDTPAGDTPSGDTPSGDTPSGDTPSGDTPSGDTPSGDTPSGDTPSGDTPSGDTPSGDTPSGDTPAGDTPSGDTPAGDTPAGDTPAEDTPAEDTPAEQTPAPRESGFTCSNSPDTSCNAFALLEILVSGVGKCTGSSSADCTAVSISQNAFQESYDEWFSDDGLCDNGKAEASAIAIASAIAKVWSNAAVKVTCEGQGFACGWSIANGQAWATAFAEAISQAAAEAGGGSNAEAFCFADIRAISVVLADAASSAQADACTNGGTVESFEASYAAAIQVGIATAFARATASACNENGEALSSSECVGEASSTTKSEVFTVGDACAGLTDLKACSSPGKEMCCDRGFKRRLCGCNRSKGAKCANGPWIRKSDFNSQKNTKRTFSDQTGEVCFCLD